MGITVTLIAYGENKIDGNMYEPLSDAARAKIQDKVDVVGAMFEVAVAKGRNVSTKVVHDTFGQGDIFFGKDAIALGMADKLGTFRGTVGKLTKGRVDTASLPVGAQAFFAPIDATVVERRRRPPTHRSIRPPRRRRRPI